MPGWNALGVGVASRFDIGLSRSGAIAVPATSPSRPAATASAAYSATSRATTPRGVSPIAFSSPISRRWASTRPLITVATVKPTAISASSVLTPMMIVLVRAWSVIVSRTSCQSTKRACGCGALGREPEGLGGLGVGEPDGEAVAGAARAP